MLTKQVKIWSYIIYVCPILQFYSASYTEDIREVVRHVGSRYPEARLYAAGWSIGANILVHYLGQVGSLDDHMPLLFLNV